MNKDQYIRAGLDIGSVSAKLAVLVPEALAEEKFGQNNHPVFVEKKIVSAKDRLYICNPVKVLGDPVKAAKRLISYLEIFTNETFSIQVTGSQGKLIAELLQCPYVNEFRAIGRGVAEIVPDAKTILEIGGDKSRFIRISYDRGNDKMSVLDYNRNGECAAGTGSFIDQQAERLNYTISDIGQLVLGANSTANIAGRCSVFAKSDMIHAQQRGYSPPAIFKGLCEAVVRNYKGTVLHGKELEPKIVFIGGVAANEGVVQAIYDIFQLTADELIVPDCYMHMGALGSLMLKNGPAFTLAQVMNSLELNGDHTKAFSGSPALNTLKVRFENKKKLVSKRGGDSSIRAYLGLDVGSVSTNLVLLDEDGFVLDEIYTRTEGKPVQVIEREFNKWRDKWGAAVEIIGVGSTGSGRELIGELVGADAVHDEITAHKIGACTLAERLFNEKVDTIFEIGGQDSKYISIEDGIVVDFTMNEACAAGTGSFLEEQALKMGISIKDEFAGLAFSSARPIKMGERCTVFMEKDVTALLQQGHRKSDIAAGLAYAVVHNYINRVVRGRKIGDKIYFQGGTAYNRAVASAFATVLGKEIIVPPHNGVIGAIGAALLAKEKIELLNVSTRFRGFDLSKVKFSMRNITCNGCTNRCDVQECTVDGEKTYWGDKCSERFRKKFKFPGRAEIPDLVKIYNDLLIKETTAPKTGAKIGIPRSMTFYDRFPFWRTFFETLGAEIILTEKTNKEIIRKGRELSIAEPCFPIIVAHGHFAELLHSDIDFIFTPNIVSSETEIPEKESWYCPWGQTVPYVIKNTLVDQVDRDKMLIPVIRFRNGKEYIKKSLRPVARKLGAPAKWSDKAVDAAYDAQQKFGNELKRYGIETLAKLNREKQKAVVLIGRPYNLYDSGVNLNIPAKLRKYYGINIVPMDFLPDDNIDVRPFHENMFWNYGRRILQAAIFIGRNKNLSAIYITNFKCGPDSYIKHFVSDCIGSPYLTLQFDDHSNDAGIMTRCEAFLASKNLLSLENLLKEKKTARAFV
ncbi:hypothetical protein JXQ31_19275 [candidate division KSB1 bacterium]|nr:hypothetical protein [candidate division KSB1 bacterium]